MRTDPGISAAAASDAYSDLSRAEVVKGRPVALNGDEYTVFGYGADPDSGFHATAYQNKKTNGIIIAYRGTDPDIKAHTRTALQDAAVDFSMVRDRLNPQKSAADAFTQKILDKAERFGVPKSQVTVAGHSLGGTLAEIEASEFGLRGVTFNSYGAVDLGYDVPEGGDKIVNYVMAGDPVSAASRHYGQVVTLASDQDLARLRDARYLDAPIDAIPPNPLLGMSMGDHSITWFTGHDSVLKPENMAQAMRNYAQFKPAIDHFRGDVYNARAELALALNSTQHLNFESTYAHLSPRMQQQLAEYHAVTVDPVIRDALEHNRVAAGVTRALDQGSAISRAGGEYLQQGGEQAARGFRSVGQAVQQRADEVSRVAGTATPLDPVLAGGVAVGAKAFGHVAHAEAEGLARTSHLAGEAAHAAGQLAADVGQGLKHGVERGLHAYASAVQSGVHRGEAAIVRGVDDAIENHARLEKMVDAVGHAYADARRTVTRGADAVQRAAGDAYDTLSHPGRWFGQAPATASADAPRPARTHPAAPAEPALASGDPRHPDSANHALYSELHRRIPDASEARLLQFTAACHAHKITAQNLRQIHFDRDGGHMLFQGAGMWATPASVDVQAPSPQPQQSIQQIQQREQQRAQMMGWLPPQNVVGPQGPAFAGR